MATAEKAIPKQKTRGTTSSSLYTLNKRSHVMKHTLVFLLTLIVSVSLTFGQNINLRGAGGSIGGTVNVRGDINNNSSTGNYSFTGTVNMNGTSGTQDIGGNTSTNTLTFATLNAVGSVAKDVLVTTTVSTAFTLNSGAAFNVNDNTLNFGGTTASTSGTFDASNASSIVNYTSGSGQTVLASTYGGTLGLSGAGAKSLGGATTAAIVNHTAASGALTVGNTFAINGSSASSLDEIIVSSTLTHSGSNTLTIANASNLTGGTITNTSSGTTAFSQGTLNTGTGTISASDGALTFAGNIDVSNASGALSVTGAATSTFTQNFTNSGAGTITFGGTSTAIYNNSTGSNIQTVLGTPYVNLTINGAGDTSFTAAGKKQVNAALTVSGTLTIAANNVFDMQSNTLGGGFTGANSGRIMWAAGNSFVAGTGVTEFYSGSAGTVAANTGYGRLWFTGSGTKTISGTVTAGPGSGLGTGVMVANNLTVDGTGVLTVNGDLDVEASGSITNTGSITVQ
jgi:hypothetical protein